MMKKEMSGIFFPRDDCKHHCSQTFPSVRTSIISPCPRWVMPGSGFPLPTYQNREWGDPKHATASADISCVALQPEKWPSGVLQNTGETMPLELRPSHITVLTFSQPSLLLALLVCKRNLQHLVISTQNISARVSKRA